MNKLIYDFKIKNIRQFMEENLNFYFNKLKLQKYQGYSYIYHIKNNFK